MAVSLRQVFRREGIANEIISLRHALANHHEGLAHGLRETCRRMLNPRDGDGYARGCRRPSLIARELAYVIPSWVAADAQETRIVEGILTKSSISNSDFPLKPWHHYYDWCFHIQLDKQYTYMLSESNINDHYNNFECEWDSAFLPDWAWPQDGSRIWMVGRWIYDCGHPENHGHKTELHPPKAVVSFRSEAAVLPGNAGPTRANNAVVYIGRDGGYWRQPINDHDYVFDLCLPPRPDIAAEPRWNVTTPMGTLPVAPVITPYPGLAPRLLRVCIPLKGVEPHPEAYGVIISGGWSDPHGTETAAVRRVGVSVSKIFMDANLDPVGRDDWHIYIGINGRWKVWKNIGGRSHALDHTIHLDLHPADAVHITACGFEADEVNMYIGGEFPYDWGEISAPTITDPKLIEMEGYLTARLGRSFTNQNDKIGHFSAIHNIMDRDHFEMASDYSDYRLAYEIFDAS